MFEDDNFDEGKYAQEEFGSLEEMSWLKELFYALSSFSSFLCKEEKASGGKKRR